MGRPKGATQVSRDGQAYLLADSGCRVATKYLGGNPSLCFECPFPVCRLDALKKAGRPKGKMNLTNK